ncbi:hypothetical protein [Glycomyces harbinensis]|uniref:DUF3558 domain-containing protein n=1 Tax=Glycomyces harbinensis TaxID=58114 RepID=A0A1G6ZMZ6_9ACTN|nr:hypothetical protein [Glycomyces harbinensis]SDE03949.1 hypothetical protein SAMN05216270_111102 [Glycomyces harbinensis]
MTVPSNPPHPARRSRKRLVVLLAAGLGLLALVGVFLVVQFSDDSPNVEADFTKATCEEFDFAQFPESSAISIESSEADADDQAEPVGGILSCAYASDAGLTLTITVVATNDEDGAAASVEQSREVWEGVDALAVEDFDNGELAGYTSVFEREWLNHVSLEAAAGRLKITILLEGGQAITEPADALDLTEELADQVHQRFTANARQ